MKQLLPILSIGLLLIFFNVPADSQILYTKNPQDTLIDIHGIPKVIYQPELNYPANLLELKKIATVTLQIEVDTNGIVQGVERIIHSTDCAFDSLAVVLALQYKFAPMGFGDKKNRVHVILPIYFDTRMNEEK